MLIFVTAKLRLFYHIMIYFWSNWEKCVSLQIEMSKMLYIIGGCNGAGKTTASYTVLPGSPELAMQRVAERVKNGGHNIPVPTTRRRYVSGINNLFNLFIPAVDGWVIYDNSISPRIEIAQGGRKAQTIVYNKELFNQIKSYVG